MATVEIVTVNDDLDPRIQSNVETVTFFDPATGRKVEIELGEANRKHLANHLEKLVKYVEAGRVVEDAKPTKKAPAKNDENAKIRFWAQNNGYQIGDRGRIKAEIVEAYNAAQKQVVAEQVMGPVEATSESDAETVSEVATEADVLAAMSELAETHGDSFDFKDLAAKVDARAEN